MICPICNSKSEFMKEFSYIDLSDIDLNYTQKVCACENCGFVFVSNPLEKENLESKYNQNSIYEFNGRKKDSVESQKNRDDGNRHFSFIQSALPDVESVLEIGCASGYLLSLFKIAGKSVYGVEPSYENVCSAKYFYDIDMYCGLVEDFIKKENNPKYDLVILSHVLEHIKNPKLLIQQIKSICKYLFIEVPCIELKKVDQPYGLFCNEHFGYYSMNSLDFLMSSCGYKCKNMYIHIDSKYVIPSGFPAISSIWINDLTDDNKNYKLPVPYTNVLSQFGAYMEQSEIAQRAVSEKIEEIPGNLNGAVYGAGPNTSRLMGETTLGEKNIKIIFDKDSRKYGKTLNGVSITEFNEDIVSELELDYIIIGAYVAQNEIYNSIKSVEKLNCKIIRLY